MRFFSIHSSGHVYADYFPFFKPSAFSCRGIKILFSLSILFFQACSTGSQKTESEATEAPKTIEETPKLDYTINPGKRVGLITPQSTEGQLRIAYGPEQVESKPITIGEGEESLGALLFPGTRNELELIWTPTLYPPRPSFVRITRDSTDWVTTTGVSIGTTIEELEKINGQPFYFYGFEWDYAGLVVSWDEGRLSEYLIVALIPGNFDALKPEFMGEVKFASDDPKLKPLRLKVGSMVIGFEE